LGLENSGYSGLVLEKLATINAKIGDLIIIRHKGSEYSGILMPRAQIGSDPHHIVIKLSSGYNIGIKLSSLSEVLLSKRGGRKKKTATDEPPVINPNLPTVSILSTGGTIASKVDYQTGAVNPALSAQDLYDTVPELEEHANVKARVLMSVLSENIHPSDWTRIAKSVALEIRKGTDGIVIAHGTDTMAFTSAALSFALQDLPIPVALVGSQRSSDRPSSDSAMNLIRATDLVGKADAAEVMVVMHGETDDSFAYAHRGTRVRKNHTSRRDAFQSPNSYPIFKITSSNFEEISPPLFRRDSKKRLKVKASFDDRVTIVRTHPGIKSSIVESLIDSGYKGIVIEGSGLGHVPQILQKALKQAIESEIVVVMTSQCISGRVDMNVYRTGVELLEMGVLPCEDMLTETALVKLMWTLANFKAIQDVQTMMMTPLAGELSMRSEMAQYIQIGREKE
jgi:glutamyl-tRNA(Gln) amidotransferase subunit D